MQLEEKGSLKKVENDRENETLEVAELKRSENGLNEELKRINDGKNSQNKEERNGSKN